jgi:ADP-ribose pyrophosphatase
MTSDNQNSALSRWKTTREDLELDCKIFKVYKRIARHPVRNVKREFAIIHGPNWIQAIALTSRHELVMVNQYRFGSDSFSWEMPGGLLDAGEDPIVGAVRELREETGYVGINPMKIGECSPNPAIQSNKAYFILMQDCELKLALDWDENEEIEVGIFPLDKVFQMARDGLIHNTITYNALFFLERYRESGKL